jgi:4-hydroxy-tetrahydrodipicolinate synthase
MIDLAGIIPAIVSPMRDAESLDLAAVPRYVEWLVDQGPIALAVNVDTGEGPHLSRDERRAMIAAVREAAGGRCRIVAGVGGPATRDAVANARDARDAGADALLVFPVPTFLSTPLRPEVVVGYHAAIADAVDLPLVLFQLQPKLGGVLFEADVLERLLGIPSVVAIKEASFEHRRFLALRDALAGFDRPITLLTGNDNLLVESFLDGAAGGLLGFATLGTREHVEVLAAARAGDEATVREVGGRLQRLADVIFDAPVGDYRARTKEALVALGVIPSAVVRPPLLSLEPSEAARVRSALEEAGLATAALSA